MSWSGLTREVPSVLRAPGHPGLADLEFGE